MNEDQTALENFNGTARLFPLPGLVFFPHAVQPLHIFEPRYRQMTADALEGDRLIALTMLRDGWENDYDDKPAIQHIACLGGIIADQQLPDGRYNMMLRGLARVRIVDEPPTDRLYRIANVEMLPDVSTDDIDELMRLRGELERLIMPRVASEESRGQLNELFHGELTLGRLCDVLAFSLPLPPQVKQSLLQELVVTSRARLLMGAFHTLIGIEPGKARSGSDQRFPPDFSAN